VCGGEEFVAVLPETPLQEARVLAEEHQAWDMNISGVPAMIVEGKFLIPGAQGPEVYVNALRRVAEKTRAAG
jgi:predicted DsbA family dithiol-disulfide isomerase